MNKIIDFIIKYRTHLLIILLVFSQFNSCKKSVRVRNLNNEIIELNINLNKVDSLIGESVKSGIENGMDIERDNIYNFILSTTKKPLDLRTRELVVKITDDIRNNKHRE